MIQESNYGRAIQLISHLLESGCKSDLARVGLHVRSAQLWAKLSNDDRAMDHFSIALRYSISTYHSRDAISSILIQAITFYLLCVESIQIITLLGKDSVA
jgi:hypothetical protein